jgi:aryl-alcohol dehydrogenase-like predicted oxidoreductase
VAIAWLVAHPGPPALVPIVGARTVEQLTTNLGALDVELASEQVDRIDTAGAPDLGFPRSFLESRGVRELIYGDLA